MQERENQDRELYIKKNDDAYARSKRKTTKQIVWF